MTTKEQLKELILRFLRQDKPDDVKASLLANAMAVSIGKAILCSFGTGIFVGGLLVASIF